MEKTSWVSIEEISEIEETEGLESTEDYENIYLMEVEGNHNYFIDGVLSKNCQNLSRLEMRSILSRMGRNVKCVCAGDVCQIDSRYLNKFNNGLNWIVKMCTGEHNYAHLVLKSDKSRGPICDMVLKTKL